MDLVQLLELRLRARIGAQLLREGRMSERRLELTLQLQRETLVDALLQLLDEQPPATPAPAPAPATPYAPTAAPVPGVKEQPTPEILDKAVKLQALAIHSPEEHERAAAWTQFEKLWQKYHLPVNLGI
jgi:hypothetical protein